MTHWPRRVWLGAVAVAATVIATWMPLAARQASLGAGTLSPVLQNVYYRPLTIFGRGGRVTAVAGVASDQKTYYMGSAGGVFKTTDAGLTWTPVTDGQIGAGSIGALAVSEADPNVVYMGTGTADPRGNVSNGDGMYLSTDAGKTWKHVGLEKAGMIGRIVIDPKDAKTAFVAAVGSCFGPNPERGLYRTKDSGQTWQQILKVDANTGAIDVTMDVKNPSTMIAAMWSVRRQPWTIDSGSKTGGLFRTTDGGDHWTKLTTGLPTTAMVGKIGVSISRADAKRVYALIEAADDQGGVYRSEDGGLTWSRSFSSRVLLQRAFYYTHIFADPVDVDTVYATNTGAFKSTDGGKTFVQLRPPHGDNHDWWINPLNNKAMIESNDGGANVSLDAGQTWSTVDNQPTQEIYRIDVDNRWPYYVYGAQQDNSSVGVPSSNSGEVILNAGPGEAGYLAVDPRNFNVIYAGNYGGTFVRQDRAYGTSTNGRVYADEETGQRAADMKYRFQWNAPIRLSPHNPDIVYTTSQHVHRSKDGGQNWETISPDLTRNDKSKQDYAGVNGITFDDTGVEVYDTIFAFEESPVTAGLLWAGTDDGLLNLSRDNGKTWEKITPPGLPEWATINVIDLSPKNAGHAIVTAYKFMLADYTPYVFETNDYGKTWKRIADGTNGMPVGFATRVVREDPDQPGLLFAGTEYGMFISYDDGGHWQRFQLNLPAVPIMDLKIYRHNLIVATEGRGFWILDELPLVEAAKPGVPQGGGFLRAVDGYRSGGGRGGGGGVTPPTFYYWLKDAPVTPVTVEVSDASGTVVYTATGQPGSGTAPQPPSPVALPPPVAGGRGAAGGGGGGQGGGGGRGGFPGGAPVPGVPAHQGLNVATWSQQRLPSPYTMPPRVIMWGGQPGPAQGPSAAPGVYTVKVSAGMWSETQKFRLNPDPHNLPMMSDADGAEQLRMAREVGGWTKTLYDNLAKIRDAKQQAADLAAKTPALSAAAKTLTDALVKVEGDMTQLKGEAGQDSLNYPGRFDNQLVALYSNIVQADRKLGTAVNERYADLKAPYQALMQRATTVLTTDIATFNAAATKAGAAAIVIK